MKSENGQGQGILVGEAQGISIPVEFFHFDKKFGNSCGQEILGTMTSLFSLKVASRESVSARQRKFSNDNLLSELLEWI